MNNPDFDSDVCRADSYGNVTANDQTGNGNDVRNETDYKGYTIDDGIMAVVWNPDDSHFGKFANAASAKAAIDAAIKSK